MSLPSLILVVALAAAAPAAVRAQAPAMRDPAAVRPAAAAPDFSGTWAFDSSKSDLGAEGPRRWVMKVRQTRRTLDLVQEQDTDAGTTRDSVAYTIGGPPIGHTDARGLRTMTSATLEGGQLVVTNMVFLPEGGGSIHYTNRWALGPDRRVLTLARNGSGPGGDWAAHLVFNRQ